MTPWKASSLGSYPDRESTRLPERSEGAAIAGRNLRLVPWIRTRQFEGAQLQREEPRRDERESGLGPHEVGQDPRPRRRGPVGDADAREGERKVINGWLWIGQPFSRVSADAKSLEMLDAKVDSSKPPLGPIWIIEPAGTNQIVLGDSNQLFLLTLHKQ